MACLRPWKEGPSLLKRFLDKCSFVSNKLWKYFEHTNMKDHMLGWLVPEKRTYLRIPEWFGKKEKKSILELNSDEALKSTLKKKKKKDILTFKIHGIWVWSMCWKSKIWNKPNREKKGSFWITEVGRQGVEEMPHGHHAAKLQSLLCWS